MNSLLLNSALKSLDLNRLSIVPVEQIPLGLLVLEAGKDLFKLYKICLQLEQLCNKEKGIGISAVQAGLPLQLFLIKDGDNYNYYLNCIYVPNSDVLATYLEGCLSLKTSKGKLRTFEVNRPHSIKVSGYQLKDNQQGDLVLERFVKDIEGFPAAVFAHEIDHGFGITIDQIGKEISIC